MATCKLCGAEIHWVKTSKGKNMPLDDKPFKAFTMNEDRTVNFVNAFMPHWSTCPNAGEFRKSRNIEREERTDTIAKRQQKMF